jgi:hypothetical protein
LRHRGQISGNAASGGSEGKASNALLAVLAVLAVVEVKGWKRLLLPAALSTVMLLGKVA